MSWHSQSKLIFKKKEMVSKKALCHFAKEKKTVKKKNICNFLYSLLFSDGFDWGIYTVDTIMDRQELRGNALLALTNFGDHALHHLFPTLDNGILPQLYDMFFETLMEFEAECQCYPWFFETIKGQFMQLSRTEPMELSSHERYLAKLRQKSKRE